ncbi:YkgJ family cysteine cluster protein [Maioricimonas sp. JC845]|uniref:YkgJ family cysteine cluster protein n=1 Tax=Maioricimonas sp. JC845 TaxID=3232138 RepID=UPI003458B481
MAAPEQPSEHSTDDAPWYREGLQFSCTQCGNCCTGSPGYVWVTEEEIAAIAEYLEKPIGEIRLMHTRPVGRRTSLREFANGDCTFFDGRTRGCMIYPVRPVQCQTWPFWKSNLSSPEAWDEVGRTCPGVGRGDFVSLDEITRQAERVDI